MTNKIIHSHGGFSNYGKTLETIHGKSDLNNQDKQRKNSAFYSEKLSCEPSSRYLDRHPKKGFQQDVSLQNKLWGIFFACIIVSDNFIPIVSSRAINPKKKNDGQKEQKEKTYKVLEGLSKVVVLDNPSVEKMDRIYQLDSGACQVKKEGIENSRISSQVYNETSVEKAGESSAVSTLRVKADEKIYQKKVAEHPLINEEQYEESTILGKDKGLVTVSFQTQVATKINNFVNFAANSIFSVAFWPMGLLSLSTSVRGEQCPPAFQDVELLKEGVKIYDYTLGLSDEDALIKLLLVYSDIKNKEDLKNDPEALNKPRTLNSYEMRILELQNQPDWTQPEAQDKHTSRSLGEHNKEGKDIALGQKESQGNSMRGSMWEQIKEGFLRPDEYSLHLESVKEKYDQKMKLLEKKVATPDSSQQEGHVESNSPSLWDRFNERMQEVTKPDPSYNPLETLRDRNPDFGLFRKPKAEVPLDFNPFVDMVKRSQKMFEDSNLKSQKNVWDFSEKSLYDLELKNFLNNPQEKDSYFKNLVGKADETPIFHPVVQWYYTNVVKKDSLADQYKTFDNLMGGNAFDQLKEEFLKKNSPEKPTLSFNNFQTIPIPTQEFSAKPSNQFLEAPRTLSFENLNIRNEFKFQNPFETMDRFKPGNALDQMKFDLSKKNVFQKPTFLSNNFPPPQFSTPDFSTKSFKLENPFDSVNNLRTGNAFNQYRPNDVFGNNNHDFKNRKF